MKTKWILIGCGKVVLKNDETMFNDDNNEIVGILTTSKGTGLKAIEKLGIDINIYDNLEELLNNTVFDAIYICTPPKYHYEYLKKLVNVNKPIIVEKPFVLNYNQCLDIYNLYKNKNVYAMLYKGSTIKIDLIKELINKYGKVTNVYGNFNRIFNEEHLKSWIYKKEISGGGRVFDIIEHILEVLYTLFGDFSNINTKVIRDSKYHNLETKVNANFLCGTTNINLNFDMESNEYKDEIILCIDNIKIIFSINQHNNIYIYENNELIKTYNVESEKFWGNKLVSRINDMVNNKEYGYIPNIDVMLKIEKCVEDIIN